MIFLFTIHMPTCMTRPLFLPTLSLSRSFGHGTMTHISMVEEWMARVFPCLGACSGSEIQNGSKLEAQVNRKLGLAPR